MAGYTPDQILESGDPILAQSQALSRLTAVESRAATGAAAIAVNAAAISDNADAISDNADAISDNTDAIAENHSALDVGVVVAGGVGAVTIQAKDGAGANLAAAIPVEVIVWKNALGVLADGTTEAGITVSTGTEDALNDASYASRKLITTDATGLIELSVEEKAGAAITFVLQVINRAGGVSPALAAVAFAGP